MRAKLTTAAAALVVAAIMIGAAGAAKPKIVTGTWTSIGLHEAVVAGDPVNTGIVYAGGSSGLVKTQNGGATYAQLNGPAGVTALAIDDVLGSAVYVGTNSFSGPGSNVYRSSDGGLTFPFSVTPRGGFSVERITLEPDNPSKVYAAILGTAFVDRLVRSKDAGATWTALLTPVGVSPTAITVDPNRHKTIWVGLGNELWKTTDGGTTWAHLDLGGTVNDVSLDPDATKTAMVATNAGLYKIRLTTVTKLLTAAVSAVNFSPAGTGEVFIAGPTGVGHSTDGGKTWPTLNLQTGATDLVVDQSGSMLHALSSSGEVWDYVLPAANQFHNFDSLADELGLSSTIRGLVRSAGVSWSGGNTPSACQSLLRATTLTSGISAHEAARSTTALELLRQTLAC